MGLGFSFFCSGFFFALVFTLCLPFRSISPFRSIYPSGTRFIPYSTPFAFPLSLSLSSLLFWALISLSLVAFFRACPPLLCFAFHLSSLYSCNEKTLSCPVLVLSALRFSQRKTKRSYGTTKRNRVPVSLSPSLSSSKQINPPLPPLQHNLPSCELLPSPSFNVPNEERRLRQISSLLRDLVGDLLSSEVHNDQSDLRLELAGVGEDAFVLRGEGLEVAVDLMGKRGCKS